MIQSSARILNYPRQCQDFHKMSPEKQKERSKEVYGWVFELPTVQGLKLEKND